MSKENIQKSTFKDLIAKKIQKEQNKFLTKDIFVSSIGKTLTFKKTSDDFILDVIDEMGDNKDTRTMVAAFEKLIYDCCEMLQDTELQKELEVVDPFDTVRVLFDLKDKMEIGEQLMDWLDIGGKVSEIKN